MKNNYFLQRYVYLCDAFQGFGNATFLHLNNLNRMFVKLINQKNLFYKESIR